MAALSKWLLPGCLCFIPLTLWADESKTTEQRFNSFVIQKLSTATANMEARQRICRASETTLTADVLKPFALSDEEKKLTLLYFGSRASWECQKKESIELLAATQLAREAGLPVFSVNDDPQNVGASTSIIGAYSMLRYKARYYALPETTRAQLEKLDALKQPFKLFESAAAIGLPIPEY